MTKNILINESYDKKIIDKIVIVGYMCYDQKDPISCVRF